VALFNFKKKKDEQAPAEAVRNLSVAAKDENFQRMSPGAATTGVILRPRVTEKGSALAAAGVYVFEVADNANKKEIAEEVRHLYNVSPVRVNIAKNPAKKVFVRGKRGVKSGVRKAYVYLKEGEKIEII